MRAARSTVRRRLVVGALALGLAAGCTAPPAPQPTPEPTSAEAPNTDAPPYLDPARPVAERVADLLGRMTLAEKAGQMVQGERGNVSPAEVTEYFLGSVLSGGGSAPEPNTPAGWADMVDGFQEAALATRLGIPILYGTDAVHGNNNLADATVFPHNIGLGAAGDPDLVERIGRATALETAAAGARWTFAPCLCVVQDTRWGRSYESFSSDPALVSALTSAVTGLQGERLSADPTSVLATAKHFVGDGGTVGGLDQGDTVVDEAELRAVHLAPYVAAIERGVGSVMVSFSSWQGVKLHGHRYLITDVLKGELGFEGFVVSDWNGIDQIDGQGGTTRAEVVAAIDAGIDMLMSPNTATSVAGDIVRAVEAGELDQTRIDDAVRRILTVKMTMGLFEHPFTDRSLAGTVGSTEHRALAREAVARSVVVLSDDSVLPLRGTVLVTGSNADDVGNQSGGWTMTWQGSSGPITTGTTILAGLREVLGAEAVVHSPEARAEDLAGVDVAVAVVGETPYAEFEGDRPDGARLTDADLALVDRLTAAGVPTVLVVVSGRPLDLAGRDAQVSAVVAAWLPGSEGAGVADVLTGAVPATGRLPVAWGDLALGHGLAVP